MLEIINQLYPIIKNCNKGFDVTSVFSKISECHYRENFHSDIIAYYLQNDEVKERFIDWISTPSGSLDGKIEKISYKGGAVKRETSRIDITLLSHDEKKAIIIENKSNNACDQFNQLHNYISRLKEEGVEIEKILYLNKDSEKKPDIAALKEDDRRGIESILKVSNLQGFIDNVINPVIVQTSNIRLNGLSQEIRSLFQILIYKDMNVDKIIELIGNLNEPGNLDKLRDVIRAYDQIPDALAEYFKSYLTSQAPDYSIPGVYNKYCVIIESILIGSKVFTVDIWFSRDQVDFSFFIRKNNGNHADVELVRSRAGNSFPFNEFRDGRYRFYHENPLDIAGIKIKIDQLLQFLRKIQSLP